MDLAGVVLIGTVGTLSYRLTSTFGASGCVLAPRTILQTSVEILANSGNSQIDVEQVNVAIFGS